MPNKLQAYYIWTHSICPISPLLINRCQILSNSNLKSHMTHTLDLDLLSLKLSPLTTWLKFQALSTMHFISTILQLQNKALTVPRHGRHLIYLTQLPWKDETHMTTFKTTTPLHISLNKHFTHLFVFSKNLVISIKVTLISLFSILILTNSSMTNLSIWHFMHVTFKK